MNFCSLKCENCTPEIRQREFEEFRDKYQAINEFHYSDIVYSSPINLILGLTNNCNLQCPYCFVHQNSLAMDLQTANRALEWAYENHTKKDLNQEIKPMVTFFGGEPLLQFDKIIKPLVEKWNDRIFFTITTNGVLLNEDIVDFFYKYNVNILLSFDGVEQVQNFQRPGKGFDSFFTILKNIPYLLLRFPETIMRATLTKYSLPYLYDTVLMAEELGFKKIIFCVNAFEDWDIEDNKTYNEQLDKICLYIYKQLQNNIFPIQVDPINEFFTKINKSINNDLWFNNNLLRCGLGTTTCAITPNGDIIPCQEKISHPTIILGNVRTGIDFNKHKEYLIDYFNKVSNITCDKGCSIKQRLVCLSDTCPSRLEDLDFVFSTSYCSFIRYGYRAAAHLHFLCSKVENKLWRNYFNEEEVKYDYTNDTCLC